MTVSNNLHNISKSKALSFIHKFSKKLNIEVGDFELYTKSIMSEEEFNEIVNDLDETDEQDVKYFLDELILSLI